MGTRTPYEFVCPECGERILVDDGTRDLLLSAGCVVCGAAVPDRAFSSNR